jgi:drug/metabolite transporter (DMT)-like permease
VFAIAAALVGAVSFAASGYAIYKSASGRQPPLAYYALFFSPGVFALAIAALCGVSVAISVSAVTLGVILFVGNLLLSIAYGRGSGLATAISISLASVLVVAFGVVVLGDDLSLRGWFGVLLLIAAVVVAGLAAKGSGGARGKRGAWLILVAATCVLLAVRAGLISWRLTISDDTASLVLVGYAVAALVAAVCWGAARLRAREEALSTHSPAAIIAGILSLVGLACFGVAVASGDVIVANAVFGLYPALTVFAIAFDRRSLGEPLKLASVGIALAGIVLLTLRDL